LSAKDIAASVLASEPWRSSLLWFQAVPGGEKILNWLSNPRIVFDTFDEAWAAARQSTYAGHDHPDYIRTHLELSKSLRPSDYAVLYWFLRLGRSNLRIFDFGGNIGNLFYSYSAYLKEARISDWTVFDLPKTIEEGRRIAAERGVSELHFTNSLENFSEGHVLLVSAALHYWEKSVQAFIKQFPRQPEHVFVNRIPVQNDRPSFITVQYKGSYAVPCMVRNVDELVSSFAGEGYGMVDRWPALELALRMPLFPNRTVPQYSGFYFRRVSRRRIA
jgi:putative methyltransferase (TIGR04325 family)